MKTTRFLSLQMFVACLILVFSHAMDAADISSRWLNPVDGNWNAAANWDSVDFPDNGGVSYEAIIDVAGSPFTVTLNTPVTIDDFSLNSADATVSQTAGTLSVLNTTDLLAGTFWLNGGTLSGGTWNESGGTLQFGNSSSNRLSNNLIFNSDVDLPDSGATVRFQSGATWTGAATLSGSSTLLAIEDTRTLDNKTINLDAAFGTARLTIEGDNTLTVGPNMLVRGQGTIASGRFVGGDQEVINEGTIRADVSATTLTINPDVFTNQGTGSVEAINGSTVVISAAAWTEQCRDHRQRRVNAPVSRRLVQYGRDGHARRNFAARTGRQLHHRRLRHN